MRNLVHLIHHGLVVMAALRQHQLFTDSAAPLRTQRRTLPLPSPKSTPLIRVWAVKGTNFACGSATSRPRKPYFPWPTPRCCGLPRGFIRKRGDWRGVARSSNFTPGAGDKSVACRLPSVIGAGLVEQQHVHVTRRFKLPARSGEHVAAHQAASMPAMPIALNKPPIVVGIKHTMSESSTGMEVNTTPFVRRIFVCNARKPAG